MLLFVNLKILIIVTSVIKKLVLEKLENRIREEYIISKNNYKKLESAERENVPEPHMQYLFSGQGSTFQGMVKNLSKNPHGLLHHMMKVVSL